MDRRVGRRDGTRHIDTRARRTLQRRQQLFQTPHEATRRIVARVRRRFTIVPLGGACCLDAIEMTMRAGRAGPTVYDALHVAAANKASAARLASADERSFPLPPSRVFNPINV